MINAIKLTLLLILSETSSCIIKLTGYSLRATYLNLSIWHMSKWSFLLREWMDRSFIFFPASAVRSWSDWTWLLFLNFSWSLLYFVYFLTFFTFRWRTAWTWWGRRRWWRFCKWHWNWLTLIFLTHLIIVFFIKL